MRLTASGADDRQHIVQRTAELRQELVGGEGAIRLPADLAGDVESAAMCRNPVRITAGRRKTGWMHDFHAALT